MKKVTLKTGTAVYTIIKRGDGSYDASSVTMSDGWRSDSVDRHTVLGSGLIVMFVLTETHLPPGWERTEEDIPKEKPQDYNAAIMEESKSLLRKKVREAKRREAAMAIYNLVNGGFVQYSHMEFAEKLEGLVAEFKYNID